MNAPAIHYDLSGKTILITGAAKRVGRTLALAAGRAGANVVVHYHQSENEANLLSSELQAIGRSAAVVQGDLANPAQVTEIFERAARLAPIDILVNNASVFAPLEFQNTTLADWQVNLSVNLTAPFILSQHFAESLPEGRFGKIINLLDWRALRPGPDHFPYTISKAALAALTFSMAAALAPRIQVNGLALGAVLPPSSGSLDPALIQRVPAGRWARLEELESAFLFLLAGPEYITGEVIHLDGGRHLV